MALTEQQAIALYETEWWLEVTDEDRVRFQLYEERLCMPFAVFHSAVEKILGRPVWTHEFAFPDLLRSELEGRRAAPSMEEIMNLIPAEKRIIIGI